MKKFTKLFLIALYSGFFLLGFCNAQDLIEEDSYVEGSHVNTDTSVNTNSEFNSEINTKEDSRNNPNDQSFIISEQRCTCGMNMLEFSVRVFLFGINILLGVILIMTLLKTISLHKKLYNTYRYSRLFYFPIINLYPLFKITIGRIRFFILLLLLGFFIYNTYAYKIFTDNNLCCKNPIRQGYSGIIVGICSIIILGVLISKLSYLIKSDNKIDK